MIGYPLLKIFSWFKAFRKKAECSVWEVFEFSLDSTKTAQKYVNH